MAIGAILKGILSGGEVIEKVGSVIDNLTTSKEEKETLRIELQKVLNDHEAKVMEHAAKMEEIEQKERDSARQREIAIATSDKSPLINKIIQPILAILIPGSCFVMWYILIMVDIPESKRELVAGIAGALTALCMNVIGYYFGSSSGSKEKQAQLDRVMKK